MTEVTCETQGHVWGSTGACVMCKATKPVGPEPVYLGDAVYASFDGYHLWLNTSDGIQTLDRIALEPRVYKALVQYAQTIWPTTTPSVEP